MVQDLLQTNDTWEKLLGKIICIYFTQKMQTHQILQEISIWH